MKNYNQPGYVLTIAAPAAKLSGEGVVAGLMFGVALHDAASGAQLAMTLEGVVTLAKTSAQAWTLGQAIYYIPATNLTTTATTTGNLFIGVAAAIADNPSATGRVVLNASAPTALTS